MVGTGGGGGDCEAGRGAGDVGQEGGEGVEGFELVELDQPSRLRVGCSQWESGRAKGEEMGQRWTGAYVASTDILLRFDVVVHNLEQEPALLGDSLDDVFERFLIESYMRCQQC